MILGKWLRRLNEYRQGELPSDMDDWPEDWREVYEERAAIMEYDGNMPRPQAEQWTETIVRAAYQVKERM